MAILERLSKVAGRNPAQRFICQRSIEEKASLSQLVDNIIFTIYKITSASINAAIATIKPDKKLIKNQ